MKRDLLRERPSNEFVNALFIIVLPATVNLEYLLVDPVYFPEQEVLRFLSLFFRYLMQTLIDLLILILASNFDFVLKALVLLILFK